MLNRIHLVVTFSLLVILSGCGGGGDSTNRNKVTATTSLDASSRSVEKVQALPKKLATAIPLNYTTPQTGWYWNPSEGGRGYSVEIQGNQIFLVAFMYEASGAPTWYASTLTVQANGQYAGELLRYRGGQTLSGPYKAPTSSRIAYIVASFTTSTAGSLYITPVSGERVVTIAIQRFPISTPTAFIPSSASFNGGWWWNDVEGGRGYFIEVQGTQAFVASFMYDDNGEPTWYVTNVGINLGRSVSGPMQQYSNGQSLLSDFKPAKLNSGNAGNINFNFTSAQDGGIILPNGVTIPAKRFTFNTSPNTPTPVCVSPQIFINGACTTPTVSIDIRPSIWFEMSPSQTGILYSAELCLLAYTNCDSLGDPVFVTNAELQDPNAEIPATLAYADQVAKEFNNIISRLWAAKTVPPHQTLLDIFRGAIAKDLNDGSFTAVQTASSAFVAAGYPAAKSDTVIPTCISPQVLKNGVCTNPANSCSSPQVLQNGECVTVIPLKVDPEYGYLQIITPANHSTADNCTSWQVIGAPVKFSTCAYKGGKSGYSVIENNSNGTADVCWAVAFNDGTPPSKGCYSSMPSGYVSKSSCYSCGSQSGYAKSIVLTKFQQRP